MKKFAFALGVVALASSAVFAAPAVSATKDQKAATKVTSKKVETKTEKKSDTKKEAAVKVTNTKKAAH